MRAVCGVPVVIAIGLLSSTSLSAQTSASAREQALEARVHALERRLDEMEAKFAAARTPLTSTHSKPVDVPARNAAIPTTTESDAAQAESGVAQNEPAAVSSAAGSSPVGIEAEALAEAPQETFVFRENAVTLKPRHFEISTDVDYSRANGFLQTDRAFSSATAIRLGLFDWLELNGTVPAFTSTRTRGTGPFRTQSKQTGGLGDVLLQANARLYEQTAGIPGVVLSVGALLPTGPRPYDFSTYQPDPSLRGYNPNPTDIKAGYLSRGAWGAVTNLQFYKTVDPLILFFGTGLRYFFPQEISGHTVQSGTIYTYNMGFSFAASEKSTIGLQILGAYEDKLQIDRHSVPQSNLEPVSVRLSLIQRVLQNTWVEPSLSAGLTQDATNLDVGLGLRHRF